VITAQSVPYEIELDGRSVEVPVARFSYAAVQVVPMNYSSTTGVIEIKKSLSGEAADAVSFSSSITPNMTTKAIVDDINVLDVAFLHIVNTTADAGKRARVIVFMSDTQ
jgi:hypothetical protein